MSPLKARSKILHLYWGSFDAFVYFLFLIISTVWFRNVLCNRRLRFVETPSQFGSLTCLRNALRLIIIKRNCYDLFPLWLTFYTSPSSIRVLPSLLIIFEMEILSVLLQLTSERFRRVFFSRACTNRDVYFYAWENPGILYVTRTIYTWTHVYICLRDSDLERSKAPNAKLF